MKVAVASGKGGVGKSLLSAYLFWLSGEKALALDCDADNPSLHAWLGIDSWEREIPLYLSEKARGSGLSTVCPFGAIRDGKVIGAMCHGCGLCRIREPDKVRMEKVLTGWIRINGRVLSAKLRPGETGSGKIVHEMKKVASRIDHGLEIRDAPAGLGCATTAALQDADYVIIVIEPTLPSVQAMEGVKRLAEHFGIKYGVVINKWNLNEKISRKVESEEDVLGKIPYDRGVFRALVEGRLPLEVFRDVEGVREKVGLW